MDLTSSLSELTTFHHKGHHTYGVDVLQSVVTDMKQLSVVEPLLNKKAQFTMATEAAISILKINEMIVPARYA
jgi:chaperonin GroEL (HSP60 family)